MSIYIGNLSFDIEEKDLTEVFSDYGTVTRVHLPVDRDTGRKRGFGFVEMEPNTDQEDKAIEALDGAQWMGRELKVNKARERVPNSGPRNGGGGGGRRNNRY
jgi:RNA recognition motif-containing protein